MFRDQGLPPPRLAAQAQSALSILTALVNSDLLAMLPIQWVESPLLGDRLEQIALAGTFVAPPIMLVHRAGIGLTPAGEYFAHLVTQHAAWPTAG